MRGDRPSQLSPEEEKRRWYFFRLARDLEREGEVLTLQAKFGLWKKKPIPNPEKLKTLERIHQAPEHMFVVTARAQILGELLGLSPKVQRNLTLAAGMHDAYKAVERAITGPLEHSYQSFRIAEAAEHASLKEAGVLDELVTLQNAAGHDWDTAIELINQRDIMDEGWAWLILYVVDMYSRGTNPATTIRERLATDRKVYTLFDETAREFTPSGEGGFDAMERTGNAALAKIAQEISRRLGITIAAEELPLFIDKELQKRIAAGSSNDNG